jgi:hypothetical protein
MPYFDMPLCIKMDKTIGIWWERVGNMPPFWVQVPCKMWNDDKRFTLLSTLDYNDGIETQDQIGQTRNLWT